MFKIFIDTNKFLDFYRYKEENKEILDKLSESNRIIITEQIIREFKRNRNIEINRLLEKIIMKEKEIDNSNCNIEPVGIYSDMIIKIDKENSKLINNIKDNIKPLKEKIKSMLKDEKSDEVLEAFNMIINNKKTIIISDSDICYNLAIKRNMLGGIPRSDKSGYKSLTICDEYIWESILNNSKNDLLFVTRDDTYLKNSELLMEEYKKKTGKKIEFVELVSSALTRVGEEISEEAKEREKLEQKYLQSLSKLSETTQIELDKIEKEMLMLSIKEYEILKIRYGLYDGIPKTLDETAKMLNMSKESIRRIEAKAIYKLRSGYKEFEEEYIMSL